MRILAVTLNPTIDVSSDVARIKPTHKMRTHNQQQHAGGGGVNVARVIAELGGAPELLIVSGGATGALLEDALGKLPIKTDVVHSEQPTRIAFIVHEEETNLEYRFVPEGPQVNMREMEAVFARLAEFDGDYLIASGSLPRGAAGDTYARMAHIAEERGVKFVLDTSGEALRVAAETARIFLMKPSIGELETILGRKIEIEAAGEAAMALVRRGNVQHVAVTLGRDGAILAGPDGILRLPAVDVPVRSAVGAGDSFVAALVWAVSQGKPVREAFAFGVAAGAATVMTTGTQLFRREDVEAIYRREFVAG